VEPLNGGPNASSHGQENLQPYEFSVNRRRRGEAKRVTVSARLLGDYLDSLQMHLIRFLTRLLEGRVSNAHLSPREYYKGVDKHWMLEMSMCRVLAPLGI
jgi:hypothetical protein